MRYLIFSMILALTCSGCMQIHADRDDICTIPTTNNPHIIPSQGQQAPAG